MLDVLPTWTHDEEIHTFIIWGKKLLVCLLLTAIVNSI
jgi:hypothetical protein